MAPGIQQRVSSRSKRRKTRGTVQKTSVKNITITLLRLPILGVQKIWQKANLYPRASLVVIGAVGLLAIGRFFYSSLVSYHETILPQSTVVNISNPQIALDVRRIINTRVAAAKRELQTRSEFIANLSQNLSGIAQLDEFWIRLGLDGKLQVTATLQVPVLVVESGTESYVIGNKLKVIQKNPKNGELSGVLHLVIPDAKFQTTPARLASRSTRFHRSAGLGQLAAKNINMPWLIRQTQFIEKTILTQKMDVAIEKMVWQPAEGFEVLFKNAPRVKLGEALLDKKIEKLAEVFSDLRARDLTAESIDLNFVDKALIKVNENSSPITRTIK